MSNETNNERHPPSTPNSGKSNKSNHRGGRGRGGGGRGRGRGGKGRGGGRGGLTPNSNNRHRSVGGRGGRRGGGSWRERDNANWRGRDHDTDLSDEDVMIKFMHFMRSGDEDAKEIFKEFGNTQGDQNQEAFIKRVRKFLAERKEGNNAQTGGNEKSDLNHDEHLSADEESVQDSKSVAMEATGNGVPPNESVQTNGSGKNTSDREDFDRIMAKLSMTPRTNKRIQKTNSIDTSTPAPTSGKSINKRIIVPPPGLGHIQVPPVTPTPIGGMHPPGQSLRPSSPSPQTPQVVESESTSVTNNAVKDNHDKPTNAKAPTATKWQPKRFQTRIQEQPGKLLVNNQEATLSGYPHLELSTKKEFVATWSLPLQYLQQRTLFKLQKKEEEVLQAAESTASGVDGAPSAIKAPESLTIRDALQSLTVGLFRRGCSENGTNHSIISKQVVPTSNSNTTKEYQFEINHQTGVIFGTVPFYSPRTPGSVVLRLYFEEDTPITLATSTCVKVVVGYDDLEQTLRFILSNFKTRKSGSTSSGISCIHSLASVLEQVQPKRNQRYPQQYRNNTAMDGIGRATWGCICESRKIVDSIRVDFKKKIAKLDEQLKVLEKEYEHLQISDSNDEAGNHDDDEVDAECDEKLNEWRERKNSVMGERASNERRWREVQGAFFNVLNFLVNKKSASMLLKHDIIIKLRLEYELWCPLCESFATNPYEVIEKIGNIHEDDHSQEIRSCRYPHPISDSHIKRCIRSREKMQRDILGFVPQKRDFPMIEHDQRIKQNGTLLCSNLSKAMEKMYNEEYVPSMESIQKKSRARDLTQNAVSLCNVFPQGTRVVIFGSSANGFGSPTSDLDMCLQLPPTSSMKDFEGEMGSTLMATLADKLEELGMKNVDKARLTARIPVIKFDCPIALQGQDGNDVNNAVMIECDISMQNPLAVINTALLRNYSALKPEVRILVAMIKRWAKSRDINNPSNHTLSSYGYIIMLLHFLTTHKATENGIELFYKQGNHDPSQNQFDGCPLLPNLQWMNPQWLQTPLGSTYQDMHTQPKNQYTIMPHPGENSFMVNKYFLPLNDDALLNNLRRHLNHHEQNHRSLGKPLVGRILASFFYYYAYEFDYKKDVVSLQSHRHGIVERGAKGENDGWKTFGQSLCIEDPFETFYDVAHVLKPSSFQRVKREFALAYSKIADSFVTVNSNDDVNIFGHDLLDRLCEVDQN